MVLKVVTFGGGFRISHSETNLAAVVGAFLVRRLDERVGSGPEYLLKVFWVGFCRPQVPCVVPAPPMNHLSTLESFLPSRYVQHTSLCSRSLSTAQCFSCLYEGIAGLRRPHLVSLPWPSFLSLFLQQNFCRWRVTRDARSHVSQFFRAIR